MTPRGCAPLVRGGGQGGKKLQGLLLGLGSCPVSPSCSSASPLHRVAASDLFDSDMSQEQLLTLRELPSLPSVDLQAAISLSLDEEAVIIHVVVVANMRILVFCLFHIHFYHTPPAPASLHPCPLAGSSPTLAGEQKRVQPRANTSATRWARWNKQNWGAFSALATLASLLCCDPTEHTSAVGPWSWSLSLLGTFFPWRIRYLSPPPSGFCLNHPLSDGFPDHARMATPIPVPCWLYVSPKIGSPYNMEYSLLIYLINCTLSRR